MKALIKKDGGIADICAEKFPVHPDLFWVDCDELITVESHLYIDGKFVEKDKPQQSFRERRQIRYNELGATIEAMTIALFEKNEAEITRLELIRQQVKLDIPKPAEARK